MFKDLFDQVISEKIEKLEDKMENDREKIRNYFKDAATSYIDFILENNENQDLDIRAKEYLESKRLAANNNINHMKSGIEKDRQFLKKLKELKVDPTAFEEIERLYTKTNEYAQIEKPKKKQRITY